MIQQQTILRVADNSGAKRVKCIKVLGGFKRKYAYTGDTIIVSIKELRNKNKASSKVKKGEIYKAVIVRTKYKTIRNNGTSIKFKDNSVVLINKKGNPVGTRIKGIVSKELKNKYQSKITGISGGVA